MLSIIKIHLLPFSFFFFFNDTPTPEIYPLPLHDALPISTPSSPRRRGRDVRLMTKADPCPDPSQLIARTRVGPSRTRWRIIDRGAANAAAAEQTPQIGRAHV